MLRRATHGQPRERVYPRLGVTTGRTMIDTLRTTLRVFVPRGQRAKWLGLVVLAIIVAGAETATAFLIFRVLGFATDPPPGGDAIDLALGIEISLVPLLILAGAAFVARGLLALLAVYAQSRIVQSAGAAVSALVHRRYLQAPYLFHLTRSSSESVRTVLWSVDQAAQNALNPLVSIATQFLITGTLFGLLVGIAPTLSLASVIVLGGSLAIVFVFVQPRLGRLGRISEDTVKSLLSNVRDSFDSVRDIKAYRAEAFFDRRFLRHRNILARVRTNKTVLDQVPASALEFVVIGGLLALIGIVQTGDSFNDFVPVLGAFGYATLRIVPSLNKVVSSLNRLKYGQQAVTNVASDLAAAVPQGIDQAASPERLFEDTVRLEGIEFTYPGMGQPAIEQIDLEIRRGELLAIAGGSGSGKSTLADIILGLIEPSRGRILIDGSEALPPGWHRHVGIVSQNVVLLDASLRDNVAFGAGASIDDDEVRRALHHAQLDDWVAGLPNGLDMMVGESGKLLSGGERQRVALARSLYRNPDLLILDEATSALDGATEAALLESLARLSGELTTIIVSHRLAPIRAADRVVLMESGRITAIGTYDELAADAVEFRDLVGL